MLLRSNMTLHHGKMMKILTCNLTSCWWKMVQGNCCALTDQRKFAWTESISRFTNMLLTASFIAACEYPNHNLSKYGWDWCDPIFGKLVTISLATILGLCTWDGVKKGGWCFRFKSLWLYMIFGVKHFWLHSIYCFMLLVQGVSFLLMHIHQGCILTFDERQPSMEQSLWWKTTFEGRWTLMEDDLW